MLKAGPLKATLVSGAMAILALGVMSSPSSAENGRNAAAAAGAIGGFAAGAAVGAATAHPDPYYTGSVRERRVIVEDNDDDCVVRTRRVWVNGVMHTRRETVCQ